MKKSKPRRRRIHKPKPHKSIKSQRKNPSFPLMPMNETIRLVEDMMLGSLAVSLLKQTGLRQKVLDALYKGVEIENEDSNNEPNS